MRWHLDSHVTNERTKHRQLRGCPGAPCMEGEGGTLQVCSGGHQRAFLGQETIRVGNHWQPFLNSYLLLVERQMNWTRSHWGLEIRVSLALHRASRPFISQADALIVPRLCTWSCIFYPQHSLWWSDTWIYLTGTVESCQCGQVTRV